VEIHTHYKNLRVTQEAPIEVIEASKKALLLKYSSKNFPETLEAHRLRTVIRTSYAILSDAEKRKRHDEWIAAKVAENIKKSESKVTDKTTVKVATISNTTNNDQLYFGLAISIIIIISLAVLFYL
jgi:DnaJ-class molecular chaperone